MKKRNSGREKKGFTLTELIIVVAIFAIMAAAAIPFFGRFLVDLEMARQNNAAKQIYLAAQNRMVSMRGAGTLASHVSGDTNLQPITIGDRNMVFADEKMSVMQSYILPAGTITDAVRDRAKGHYVVVFDKVHGLVQEVYFAEAPLSESGTVSADTLGGWRNDTAARRNSRVGYYNGTGDAANAVVRMQKVKLDLTNDEILTARITLPDITSSPGLSFDKLLVKLKVENADDSTQVVEWALELKSPDFDWIVNGIPQIYGKELDSLIKPFATVFADDEGNSLITPGANLVVTAVLSVKPGADTGDVTYQDSAPVSQRGNSLFGDARVQTVPASPGSIEKNHLSLDVSYGRHIANLNLVTDPPTMIPDIDQDLFFANQTRSIYFYSNESGTTAWNWAYGNRETPMVNNTRLLTYDGGGYGLVGITRPLFYHFGAPQGTISANEYKLQNVTIFWPRIDYTVSRAYEYYGTLACYANATQIYNCHVTGLKGQSGAKVKVSGVTVAGGLVGFAFGTAIINSSVSIPQMEVKVISQSVNLGAASAAQVGGLVGQSYEPIPNATVLMQGCFVDIGELHVEGGRVGMLMGNNWQGTTVDSCYVVGKITGTAFQAGGLFGTDISTVVEGQQYIYDCYALVDLNGVNAKKFAALPGFNEGIKVDSEGLRVDNIYFVKAVTGEALVDGAGKSTEITLEQLRAGSDADGKLFFDENNKWSVGGTVAQSFTPGENVVYPYPAIVGIMHRGEWPT